ncbi:MAG: hypothetical protein MZV64_48095 [Ignavibacteriales bacterium]|nr:hypothetical protein [Ignavibacteriales bacterium]
MELTDVINKTDLVIGVDFNIVVLSMDELETPKDAMTKKQTFFRHSIKLFLLKAGSF